MADGEAAPRLDLRSPDIQRLFGVLGLVNVPFLLALAAALDAAQVLVPVPVFLLLGVGALGLRFRATTDGLFVRNHLRRCTLAWPDVVEFAVVRAGKGLWTYGLRGSIIRVSLVGGRSVEIAASHCSNLTMGHARAWATNEARCEALRAIQAAAQRATA